MPTVTAEVRIPFWQRFRFLLSGRIFVQAILDASWYTQLRVTRGEAWIDYGSGAKMLRDYSVHPCIGRDMNGTTVRGWNEVKDAREDGK